MKKLMLGSFLASLLVGCGASSDVSTDDVKSKEAQAEAATKALNGGKAPSTTQGE